LGPRSNNTEPQVIKHPEPKEGLGLRYTVSGQLGVNEGKSLENCVNQEVVGVQVFQQQKLAQLH